MLKEYVKNKKIEEFAHEITAGDPYLEKECLRMCLKNKLEDAFIKLCKTYHYEFDPEFFRSYEQISCEEKSLFFSSNSDAILRCNNPVYFIDDMESFEQAKNKLLSTATPPRLLAIDCEQKIKLFEFESRKIVLLQLSTEHFNFIFDMLKFRMYSTEWSALFQMLFLDTDLLKIGFGIPGDFCILHKKFKDVSDCFLILKNCFDVYSFETKNKELSNVSLKSLCFELFKLELSKVECVSDWMRRPLRPSQLEYAALDAEILIRLFQHYSQNYLPSDLGVGIRDTMRFD